MAPVDDGVESPRVVSTLAAIIETDDIAIEKSEASENNQSAVNVVANTGQEGDAPSALPDSNAASAGSAVHTGRRPSAVILALEQTRRSLQQQRKASWGAVLHSAQEAMHRWGPTRATVPPEAIRSMPWRIRVNFYLSHPSQSLVGWVIHHVIGFILCLNIAVMASETLDGPRFEGTQPGYDYLPEDEFYVSVELGFTLIYILEFLARCTTNQQQKTFWKSRHTWLELVALAPAIIYQGLDAVNKDTADYDGRQLRATLNYLRLARIVRVIVMTHVYDGSKIMFKAMSRSIAPLKITFFFLITVVMVFATAIFYAEPCYDLRTCTFTDIFNAGYFVMVTVATVGYGSQVPSLYNGGSLVLSCVVMIFGSLYLAMPLAIVGIRYDSAWREYEEAVRQESITKAKALQSKVGPEAALAVAAAAAAASVKEEEEDASLQALESRKVYTLSYQICNRFYDISQKIGDVNETIEAIIAEPELSSPESSLQRVKTRNDLTVKVLENIMGVLKVHKKVCTEIRGLLPTADSGKKAASPVKTSSGTLSLTGREGSFSKSASFATGVFGRARRAFSSVRTRSERLQHVGPVTWRSKVWDVIEHNDRSRRAMVINKIRLYIVVASIALFYAQTTPEFQQTGVRSALCRRAMEDFCSTKRVGYYDQPGCFVFDSQGLPTTERVNFDCDNADHCSGYGHNYGSDHFSVPCPTAFGRQGVRRVCNNRLCKPPVAFWMDMEPHWIFFEVFFNAIFTVEVALRVITHPKRKQAWKDMRIVLDVLVLLPFYVEIFEIMSGYMPIYSVVPTAPSFKSVIRVLKTLRILKLGPHIAGSEVLARTAILVYKRLMIPVFFLFIGSVICGAIFYELERGVECFVGQRCLWWDKNVLTPAIAGNHPTGKRILVQNDNPAIITDMIRSTWFALVTITTVGYGDLVPRTPLGRLFDILTMIMSACYTAMPLTLVGGQFYVCYEIYLRDEKRNGRGNTKAVEPKKTHDASSTPVEVPMLSLSAATTQHAAEQVNEIRQAASPLGLDTLDPIIPGLNAPLAPVAPSPPPSPAPLLVSRREACSSIEPKRPVITSVEMQILNQFIMIHKVLSQVIEDLSKLNQLGSRRFSIRKPTSSGSDTESSSLRQSEKEVEKKITENMAFCVTVFLNFSPVVEKILGINEPQARLTMMPSILHTAMGTVGTHTELHR